MADTIEVKIERGKPAILYDVKVGKGRDDIVWWAPGASFLNVRFENVPAVKLNKGKGQPVIEAVSGAGFRFNKNEHSKVDTKNGSVELKYTIEALYPDGSQILIDPMVIIQP